MVEFQRVMALPYVPTGQPNLWKRIPIAPHYPTEYADGRQRCTAREWFVFQLTIPHRSVTIGNYYSSLPSPELETP
jgi:hypothetical protein